LEIWGELPFMEKALLVLRVRGHPWNPWTEPSIASCELGAGRRVVTVVVTATQHQPIAQEAAARSTHPTWGERF